MTDERTHVGWKFWLGWVLASMAGFAVILIERHIMGFFMGILGPTGMTIGAVSSAVAGAMIGAVTGTMQWLVLRRRISGIGWWVLASIVGFAVGLAIDGVLYHFGLTEHFLVAVMKHSLGAFARGEEVRLLDVAGTMIIRLSKDEFYVRDAAALVLIAIDASITCTMAGLAIGLAQWVTLRRRVSRAGWWVLASTVGWAGGTLVATIVYPAIFYSLFITLAGCTPDRAGIGQITDLIIAIVIGYVAEVVASGGVYGAITGGTMVGLLRHSAALHHWPTVRRWLLVMGLGSGLVLVAACLAALVGGVPIEGQPMPTPYQGNLPLRITGQDGKEMVLVPAGEFLMGSNLIDNEKPQRTVTLNAFYIDRTEVTNAEFCRFLNEQGNQSEDGATWLDMDDEHCRIVYSGGQYRPQDGYADHPVVEVTWYGARAYAQWAGKRLPTEAEWEKAARGTDGRLYPWGNIWDPARANTGYGGPRQTTPVGQYSPGGDSPYGCADMAGNVREWTSSVYGDMYGRMINQRVVRGGSWFYSQNEFARCSHRYGTLTSGGETVGFRCVRAADAPETTP